MGMSIFLVLVSEGFYSERTVTPVHAFGEKADAEYYAKCLEKQHAQKEGKVQAHESLMDAWMKANPEPLPEDFDELSYDERLRFRNTPEHQAWAKALDDEHERLRVLLGLDRTYVEESYYAFVKEVPCSVMRARLDEDGTAKPKTEIVAHHNTGECIQPGVNAISYSIRENH